MKNGQDTTYLIVILENKTVNEKETVFRYNTFAQMEKNYLKLDLLIDKTSFFNQY